MENSAAGETEAPDTQEETKEAPPLEMEKEELIETEEAEDVSYMFNWDYTSVKGLSDAGYALLDLDGNEVPELLVSTVVDAECGTIYDLYTYAGGEAIHAANGGERFSYSLCEDGTIYYVSPDGAVSCIDTFSVIYGFGDIYPAMNWNPVIDAGGEGYYLIFYEYDPASGEFIINETAVSASSTESGETAPDLVNSNTENVASEPSCEHVLVRKEELVSQETGENMQSTVVRWYSECRKCGVIRNY